jgi:hypothetical protein
MDFLIVINAHVSPGRVSHATTSIHTAYSLFNLPFPPGPMTATNVSGDSEET